ncbi:hypothetical protein [Leptospira kirschneri]|uniref:hypothetical protein n=1 Tax=Leptospira kirschneri TaxID=29507 RepID=UPI0002BDF98C|nr:hypothetical protein [Leptospira kirschneri]EMO80419.1 hypothetical protein LEP1GSC126_2951 [Leptospira kirschneri str. 200801774]KON79287.1 Uncharacterized protein NV38_0000105 [Leptospira kirschneri serovar Mozdok]KPZ77106.1 hypothetical protein APS47_12725 [Leptospira kirschneri serovar Mozdok]
MTDEIECTLLGLSLLMAQKVEFALYGIVAHISIKDKKFKNLTPETFLRGDLSNLKATLGQLKNYAGGKLLLSSNELQDFVDKRNLIVHNYWRLTKANIKNAEKLLNPEQFLRNFIDDCQRWTNILNGYIKMLMQSIAETENRTDEINFGEKERQEIEVYIDHVYKSMENINVDNNRNS